MIKSFFHPATFTLTYLIYDEKTLDAVLIDPVADYDPKASTLSFKSAEIITDFINKNDLNIHYLLETHAHADHLSASQFLKKKFPKAIVAIGSGITNVQTLFKDFFQIDKESEGKSFDKLLKDEEKIQAGSLCFKVLSTPGHTPACVSYLFEDTALFVGDLIFAPDYGTGRCDFPGGSSRDMYQSLVKVYELSDDILVYPGHDYMPGGRMVWDNAPLAVQKSSNVQFRVGDGEEQFCSKRDARDATLSAPALLLQSVQFNVWGAKLPGEGGEPFFKIPLRLKE